MGNKRSKEAFLSAEFVKFNKFIWQFDGTPFSEQSAGRAVALGIFNGVHLGHRAVISNSVGAEFEGTRLTSTMLTFDSTSDILGKDKTKLVSEERRDSLLKGLGVNELITLDFKSVKDLSPEEFVAECLVKGLNTKLVCCGHNYNFGKDGVGNVETLKSLCEKYAIRLIVADEVLADGELVSSTRIRTALSQGKVRDASKLLGYQFGFNFPVVDGQHLGRTLGAPTINQPMPQSFVWPKFGVYASAVIVDGEVKAGVTNVGRRPTVGSDSPLAETWISDYSGDLYGENVPVFLVKFLREEKKFDSIDELKTQILADGAASLNLFCGEKLNEKLLENSDKAKTKYQCILFDFDDTLQDREVAFTKFSRAFIKRHFPLLSSDETERRVGDMVERNKGGYVNYFEYLETLVEIWRWENAPSVEELVFEVQLDFPSHSVLFNGATEMLVELKNRGYLLGMITNGPSFMQNRKVDVSGIRHLFDIVTVAGDEGVQKPNPEVFKRTAYKLGISPEECIFAGDHPVNDIQGALSANMDTIYINPAGNYLFDKELEILDSYGERVRKANGFKDILKLLK